jgi:hypothetical protein
MAVVCTKGYTFGSTEAVTNTKLHQLVDDATVTGIVETYTSVSLGTGEGMWTIAVDGDDLVFYREESAVNVEKGRITA